MVGSSLASSLQSPTADESVPSRYPSWVLLDTRAHFAHHENATAKKVRTSTDQEVEISICLTDPPAVSHFCIHSPKIRREDYSFDPRVVSSAKNLVLLCFAFRTGIRSTDVDSGLVEFFVWKASSGGNLSIEPVPYSPTGTRHSSHAGIVPCDGGNFLIADLSLRENPGHYDLYVFSSKTSKWTNRYLQLLTPVDTRNLPSQLDKVIFLRGSVIGWVDLWHGIITCDVLEKKPVLSFIPLPTTGFNLHRTGQAQKLRDVSCCNGFISFVEIEHCIRERNTVNSRSFKMIQDLDTEDVIFDKAFLVHGDLDDKPEPVPDGWKIRTMYRGISWDYWKKRHTVHVDDISDVPGLSVLLPQLLNDGAMKCTLTTAFPFFGVYGDNVVFLMSKVEYDDEDSWVVGTDLEKKKDDKYSWIFGVDLEKKKLDILKPYCAASASDPTVLPCAFSEYMNATPRPYAELVAASFSQNRVLNNHLPLGNTLPVASSAQNGLQNKHIPLGDTISVASSDQSGVLNNHLPDGDTIQVASSAQNGVPNCQLPLGDTVPDNLQHQQNTLNVDGYYGSCNELGYGAHSGCISYQQLTPLQIYVLPPNMPPTVQPMSSSTLSGYIFARWSDPDVGGKMLMTVPLNDMMRLAAASLDPAMPPMPVHTSSAYP